MAVDGFWFPGDQDGEAPHLFAEHYTAATKTQLPFMHLERTEPILEVLTAAGFVDVAAERRPDLAIEGAVPYLITAARP